MKHYATPLIALLLALCTFISCSKPIEESPIEEKSHVTVNVSPFSLSMEEMGATRAALKDAATSLSFAVFNTEGNLVNKLVVHQKSQDERFGMVQFDLSPGTYTMVAVAHNVSDYVAITSTSSVTLPGTYFSDTFSKIQKLTVVSGQDYILDMDLPRITSAFILKISDVADAPEDLSMIQVKLNTSGSTPKPSSLVFDPSSGCATESWVQERMFPATNLSSGIPIYFIGKESSCEVDITATAYNDKNEVIMSHTLQKVPLKANQKTIATGKFFETKVVGAFTLNTTWETDKDFSY